MLEKKNPRFDVRKYRGLFFNIGLVATLGVVLTAFEWKTIEPIAWVDLGDPTEEPVLFDPPLTNQPPPPPPPKIENPVIIEVPDPVKIDATVDLDLDINTDEQQVIETIIFSDEPKGEEVEFYAGRVEQDPKFMGGGQEEFLKYVGGKLKYPDQARRLGIEGKVFVQFVVDKDGKMADVKVIKGIGAGCDEEVLRVLNEAPAWEPGKQRGKAVKVRMIVPVTFRLQ